MIGRKGKLEKDKVEEVKKIPMKTDGIEKKMKTRIEEAQNGRKGKIEDTDKDRIRRDCSEDV